MKIATGHRIALIEPRFPRRRGMLVHWEYEPFGCMMLSAALKREGFKVRFWQQEPASSADRLARQVADWGPDIVGISAYTSNFPEGRRIARNLKSLGTSAQIVFGGVHATIAPDIVQDESVDYVLRGEGETAAPAMFRAILEGKPVDSVPGAVRQVDGRMQQSLAFELISDLSSLPWADRSLVGPTIEYSLGAYGLPKAIVMTSRGCPSACTFCCAPLISRRQVRLRDPGEVVREVCYLRDVRGVRFICFADDEFFAEIAHVEAVCKELIKNRAVLPFFCMGKIDLLDFSLLELLAKSGCRRIFFGMERPPGKTRWASKARDVEAIDSKLRCARRLGVFTQVGFIIGFPDEDHDSLARLEDYVKELPADYLSVTVFTPFRGTALYNLMVKQGIRISGEEERFIYDSVAFEHPHLTGRELLQWRQKILRSFYLSRAYLRRATRSLAKNPSLGLDYGRMLLAAVRGGLFSR